MDDYDHLLKPLPLHPSGVQILAGLSLHSRPNLRPWFDAGEQLVMFVHEKKPPTGVRDKQGLLWTSLVRSMKTYRAVLVLCDSGFGEQAGMLCRSLFEDLLVTHWMKRTDGDELRRRFLEHADRVTLVDLETTEEHGYEVPPTSAFLSEDRLAELEASGGTRGAFQMWHGQKVRSLLEALAAELPPDEAALLDEMHDLNYRLQNLLLHHSPRAFEFAVGLSIDASLLPPAWQQQVREGQAEVPMITSKPGPKYVQDALRSAYFSVSRQALAVLEGEAQNELAERLRRDRRFVVRLTREELRAGRNDPCPCGSGLKFKACHGTAPH